jgi:hypothetical protein
MNVYIISNVAVIKIKRIPTYLYWSLKDTVKLAELDTCKLVYGYAPAGNGYGVLSTIKVCSITFNPLIVWF